MKRGAGHEVAAAKPEAFVEQAFVTDVVEGGEHEACEEEPRRDHDEHLNPIRQCGNPAAL